MKASLILSLLLIITGQVYAQSGATYNSNTGEANIPNMQVTTGEYYDVKLKLDPASNQFNLVNAIPTAQSSNIQLGPRAYFLVENMDQGELKTKLQQCQEGASYKTDFSIGHRGAAMQFPEHTKQSYLAAARMGAGIVECDVTFTKDKQLVCRHSQCDLHTTTDILAHPELAAKCSVPFDSSNPGATQCCTSDISLAEFKSLCGKMDAANVSATSIEEYMNATAAWRTDLYSSCATLMTHAESIELFKQLGVKMTPELKTPSVDMPFEGTYSQENYAQQMIDEYKAAGVTASNVFAQSFNYSDVKYWIANEPSFGAQAVYLDGRAYQETAEDKQLFANFDANKPETWAPRSMANIVADGINYIAPPMWVLVTLGNNNQVVPSEYAKQAKAAGLNMLTWTLERSGPLNSGGGWYYQTTTDATNNDGDMLNLLHVLAQDVGIKGIFSDWPATVTYYANCMGIE